MTSHQKGDPELRPDSIGTRYKDRVTVPLRIEPEQPAESPDVRQDLRPERRPDEGADSPDKLIPGVDIHPCLLVIHLSRKLLD